VQQAILLKKNWGDQGATGQFLKQAYEVFQVETGLLGIIFSLDYAELESLVTHGWFKHLWQLCQIYKLDFTVHKDFDIPLLREDDWTIMDEVIRTTIYLQTHLMQINRVRKFKGRHSMADLVLCEGITINSNMLTRASSCSNQKFPRERPPNDDFNIWNECLRAISLNTSNYVIC